jgi:mono/diheme cytochrome c family protein
MQGEIMLRNAVGTCCLSLLLLSSQVVMGQGKSKPVDLGPLQEATQKAAQLIKDNKVVECVGLVEKSTLEIQELAKNAPNTELAEIKKLHSELAKLHQQLAVQGAELGDLPTWDALLKAKKNSGKKTDEKKTETTSSSQSTVSFSKDIAPWLVEQCSRCHINAERGGLSLASFNAIVKGSKSGVVLFPGDPIGSRLVETIETGDMPRSGNKVTPENLAKLKQWVKEGAKYDGPSPDAPLVSLLVNKQATPTNSPAKVAEPTKFAEPSGKETVSFARDIAPILIANCNGCHYNATRVSGGLQLNTIVQLVKGGDSGPIVLPGKPDESLLVRKLKGMEGARMPMGRAALPDSQIQLVATWIKEGATFDGQSKDAKLDQVVGHAFASKATHEELMAKRVERSREKWKIAFPKGEPDEALDEHFHVIGNMGEESTKSLLAQANAVSMPIRKLLKIPAKEPLIKGGITIYALKQRYDYSEFGKMIEGRTLPAEWSSHWRKEVLDAYVAIVVDKSESKINETSLLQQLTSLWVGSRDGVPKWFAEGAGRQALAVAVGSNDLRVQPWLKRIPASMDQMKNLKALSDGTMNDEALATIGFGVIRTMYDSKMKTQYELILKSLASGMSFEQATTKAIGSMDLFLQKLLGKPK